jgi:alginate O-acetyltransferase complex protein AlgI
MVFSSLSFLFLFFPFVFSFYLILPSPLRNIYLLIFSLGFYAAGEGGYVLILVFTIGFNWIFGLVIERAGKSRARWALVATGVAVNVLLLAVFKYANFIAANLNGVQAGAWPALPPIHLPIGISFFTFQAISYLLDVARHDVTAERNPVTYGAYKAFFPQLIAGPIVGYRDVRKEFHGRRLDIDDVLSGTSRFVIGLAKKVLIADVLAKPVEAVMALPHFRRRLVRRRVLCAANLFRFLRLLRYGDRHGEDVRISFPREF